MATEIERKVEILQDICSALSGKLQEVQSMREGGKEEIDDVGQISPETCLTGSRLMKSVEEMSRQLYTGSLSVHQSMSAFVPEGASEGSKKWPP